MLKYKKEYDHYVVYLDGEFLETCYNYQEVREVYARYGKSI